MFGNLAWVLSFFFRQNSNEVAGHSPFSQYFLGHIAKQRNTNKFLFHSSFSSVRILRNHEKSLEVNKMPEIWSHFWEPFRDFFSKTPFPIERCASENFSDAHLSIGNGVCFFMSRKGLQKWLQSYPIVPPLYPPAYHPFISYTNSSRIHQSWPNYKWTHVGASRRANPQKHKSSKIRKTKNQNTKQFLKRQKRKNTCFLVHG